MDRKTPPWRHPREPAPADEAAIIAEAQRCIQCPDPTCVSGCPACNPVHQWLQLTAEGRIDEAARLLASVSSLAELCARFCPADQLCEHHCLLDSVGEPVSIRAIEQFLADYAALHQADDAAATAPPKGRTAAVIGSGIGPLAFADFLSKLGWQVVLLEPGPVPNQSQTRSKLVPNQFKTSSGLVLNQCRTSSEPVPDQLRTSSELLQNLTQRRLDLLRKRGVTLQLNVPAPDANGLAALGNQYDAVYQPPDEPLDAIHAIAHARKAAEKVAGGR